MTRLFIELNYQSLVFKTLSDSHKNINETFNI